MKRIFTLLLAVIMLFTFMTACSVNVLDREEEGKEYIKKSEDKKPSEGFTKKEKANYLFSSKFAIIFSKVSVLYPA